MLGRLVLFHGGSTEKHAGRNADLALTEDGRKGYVPDQVKINWSFVRQRMGVRVASPAAGDCHNLGQLILRE